MYLPYGMEIEEQVPVVRLWANQSDTMQHDDVKFMLLRLWKLEVMAERKSQSRATLVLVVFL